MIDVQEKPLSTYGRERESSEMTQVLLQGHQMLGVPVVVTQQYTKGLGATFPELAGILGSITFS
jgi:hypothetical protein